MDILDVRGLLEEKFSVLLGYRSKLLFKKKKKKTPMLNRSNASNVTGQLHTRFGLEK